jgi:hypothetical protein
METRSCTWLRRLDTTHLWPASSLPSAQSLPRSPREKLRKCRRDKNPRQYVGPDRYLIASVVYDCVRCSCDPSSVVIVFRSCFHPSCFFYRSNVICRVIVWSVLMPPVVVFDRFNGLRFGLMARFYLTRYFFDRFNCIHLFCRRFLFYRLCF